jgi:hypothetical protein
MVYFVYEEEILAGIELYYWFVRSALLEEGRMSWVTEKILKRL